jgi:ketosteroid isomerase-like protein
MNLNGISRRVLLGGGLGSLAFLSAELEQAKADQGGTDSTREQIIRSYYSGWETKDWSVVDRLTADGFTFSSAAGDDHINKKTFYDRCWGQAAHIKHFDLESVAAAGDSDAFVKYLCHTSTGTSFRNIEYFRFAGGKIASIECYFGGSAGYPTASESGKS